MEKGSRDVIPPMRKKGNFKKQLPFFIFVVVSLVIHLFLMCYLHIRTSFRKSKTFEVKIYYPLHKSVSLIRKGNSFAEKGMYSLAIKSFNEVLVNSPHNIHALLGKGIVFAKMGRVKMAEKEFEKIRRFYPHRSEGYYGLAMVNAKQDRYKKALTLINKAIDINPNDPQYYADRGYMWIFMKDYKRAEEDFKHSLRMDPQNPFANAGLGEVYRREDRLKEAASYYQKALEIYNHIPKGYLFLASAYFDMDRFQEAISLYKKELEKIKRYGQIDDYHKGACYAEMARTYAILGNLGEAKKNVALFFKSVNKIDLYEAETDEYLGLLEDIANAYIEMAAYESKYYDKALFYYLRCIHFTSRNTKENNLYYRFQVGWIYWEQKNFSKALKYFKDALHFVPKRKDRYGWWMIGHIYTLTGRYEEALKIYSISLKLDPTFEYAYFSRALTYYLMGKNKEALKDIEKVEELRKEGQCVKIIYEKAERLKEKIRSGVGGSFESIKEI